MTTLRNATQAEVNELREQIGSTWFADAMVDDENCIISYRVKIYSDMTGSNPRNEYAAIYNDGEPIIDTNAIKSFATRAEAVESLI